MVCKLSIVIPGTQHAGAIVDLPAIPNIGDQLALGDSIVEVMEVIELLPPRGDFRFVHATCRLVANTPLTKHRADHQRRDEHLD